MTPQTLLQKAMEEHKAGDMESAKALYEQILAHDPYDADALNLLGVLCLQCGDLSGAFDLIQRAIDADPGIAAYHHNLGQVLNRSGDANGARACYQRSLTLDPGLEIAKDQLNAIGKAGTVVQPNELQLRKEMKRYEVVQHVIDRIKGRTYLEIGVDGGQTFINTRAARKIGVDPEPTSQLIDKMLTIFNIDYFSFSSTTGSSKSSELMLTGSSNQAFALMPPGETAELFYMTSDSFFMEKAGTLFHSEKIDVAFIDGLHTYEQTCNDVLHVLEYLSDTGVLLMHDCNPPTASSAAPARSWKDAAKMNLPGWNGQWCGDVWKTIALLRAVRDDLNIFVLDCDFGIGVVSKGSPDERLHRSVNQIEAMTFDDLNVNRDRLLNLKPQEYLFEFLASIEPCQ